MWCRKCGVMRRGALPSIVEPPLFLSPDNTYYIIIVDSNENSGSLIYLLLYL